MLETDVVLEYVCGFCSEDIKVTLKCEGKGVAEGPHTAAKVKINCPTCQCASDVYFELSGLVLHTAPTEKYELLEPSLN